MAPKDIRERIPLHYAAKGGYEKIVKLLLQCWNADSYIKSNSQDQGHRNRYNIIDCEHQKGLDIFFEIRSLI